MRRISPILVFLLLAAPAVAAPKITFEEQVKPIFREHCCVCHNQGKATNDLAAPIATSASARAEPAAK